MEKHNLFKQKQTQITKVRLTLWSEWTLSSELPEKGAGAGLVGGKEPVSFVLFWIVLRNSSSSFLWKTQSFLSQSWFELTNTNNMTFNMFKLILCSVPQLNWINPYRDFDFCIAQHNKGLKNCLFLSLFIYVVQIRVRLLCIDYKITKLFNKWVLVHLSD